MASGRDSGVDKASEIGEVGALAGAETSTRRGGGAGKVWPRTRGADDGANPSGMRVPVLYEVRVFFFFF